MTQEEFKRKTCLDKAIDRRITQKAAAETLGISERQASFFCNFFHCPGSAPARI